MSKERIVRRPRAAAINFGLIHVGPFTDNMAAIGLQSSDLTSYNTAVTNANDANIAVLEAKMALKAATSAADERLREMSAVFTTVIGKIDAFAANSADPTHVYDLAQLPAPVNPSEMPPPGQPESFKATLNLDGTVRITFKCKNPPGSGGTVYAIRRKLLNSSTWTNFGVTGTRSFVDTTIPSASGGAVYQVTGQRGASQGDASAPFTVQFGVDGGGMVIASQFEGGEGKMAA